MDDGLAERLFNAFWAPIVAAGYPPPAKWSELGEAQQLAWQAAATAARGEMKAQIALRTEMLQGANAAWQREHAELQAKLEQHVENVRAATRETMARFASVLDDAIKASPGEARAMLKDLRDGLDRISVVS